MLTKLRSSGLIWPTIFAIVGLLVLVGLGNWQWSRMHWKAGLLKAIAERTTADPVALSELDQCATGEAGCQYTRVKLTGTFDHANERHVYGLGKEGPGWHVFTPFKLAGQLSPGAVWINRGFVPDQLKVPATREGSQPAGQVNVIGLYRTAIEPGYFVPEADHVANIWYAPDTMAMSAALEEQSIGAGGKVAPTFYFDAEHSGDRWPRGGTTNLTLSNKHYGYALTWWGLALTLIGVYLTFAWQRLREA